MLLPGTRRRGVPGGKIQSLSAYICSLPPYLYVLQVLAGSLQSNMSQDTLVFSWELPSLSFENTTSPRLPGIENLQLTGPEVPPAIGKFPPPQADAKQYKSSRPQIF